MTTGFIIGCALLTTGVSLYLAYTGLAVVAHARQLSHSQRTRLLASVCHTLVYPLMINSWVLNNPLIVNLQTATLIWMFLHTVILYFTKGYHQDLLQKLGYNSAAEAWSSPESKHPKGRADIHGIRRHKHSSIRHRS